MTRDLLFGVDTLETGVATVLDVNDTHYRFEFSPNGEQADACRSCYIPREYWKGLNWTRGHKIDYRIVRNTVNDELIDELYILGKFVKPEQGRIERIKRLSKFCFATDNL